MNISGYANSGNFHVVLDELCKEYHSIEYPIHDIAGLEHWTLDIDIKCPFPLSIQLAL